MVKNKRGGGVLRWFKCAAMQKKKRGGGGTIKLKRRTIKLSTFCLVLATRVCYVYLFLKLGI